MITVTSSFSKNAKPVFLNSPGSKRFWEGSVFVMEYCERDAYGRNKAGFFMMA